MKPAVALFQPRETIRIEHRFKIGFPTDTVLGRWYHNGELITSENRNVSVTFSSESKRWGITTVLEIPNAGSDDSGNYVFSTGNSIIEMSALIIRIIDGW